MARLSGWLVVGLLVVAACVPLLVRLRAGKRAAPQSRAASLHVVIGLVTASVAFVHTLVSVLALGSEGAIAAGELALAFGAVAFLALTAHTGIGLQLRDPKLRRRADKRRTHVITAATIAAAALLHAWLLLTAA